jgi:hypothetical protein
MDPSIGTAEILIMEFQQTFKYVKLTIEIFPTKPAEDRAVRATATYRDCTGDECKLDTQGESIAIALLRLRLLLQFCYPRPAEVTK